MKKLKLYEQFLNEAKSGQMPQQDLIKFLKKLPQDASITMPSPIRGGEAFQTGVYSNVSAKEALSYVSKYNPKKSTYGEMIAKIWHVDLLNHNAMVQRQFEIRPFEFDPNQVIKRIEEIKTVKLSFDFADFDSEAYRDAVRSSSLD